jgi:hypothetical protein
VTGVLSEETWSLLSKRAPNLGFIYYENPETLTPSLLNEFLTIPSLYALMLKMPNSLTSVDLVPFLETFIGYSKDHPSLTSFTLYEISGNDKEDLLETVEDILKCLHSTVVEGGGGDICINLYFSQYDGDMKFEFSEEMSGFEVEVKVKGEEGEETSAELHIRSSQYFDAGKNSRKLQIFGKRHEARCASGTCRLLSKD